MIPPNLLPNLAVSALDRCPLRPLSNRGKLSHLSVEGLAPWT